MRKYGVGRGKEKQLLSQSLINRSMFDDGIGAVYKVLTSISPHRLVLH